MSNMFVISILIMESNSEEKAGSEENVESLEITKKQLLFLSVSDFLIIVVIIVDLMYISDLLPIAPGDMMTINVVTVSISYVAYQIKKRLRKINLRKKKAKSTSQESQH